MFLKGITIQLTGIDLTVAGSLGVSSGVEVPCTFAWSGNEFMDEAGLFGAIVASCSANTCYGNKVGATASGNTLVLLLESSDDKEAEVVSVTHGESIGANDTVSFGFDVNRLTMGGIIDAAIAERDVAQADAETGYAMAYHRVGRVEVTNAKAWAITL